MFVFIHVIIDDGWVIFVSIIGNAESTFSSDCEIRPAYVKNLSQKKTGRFKEKLFDNLVGLGLCS